MNPPFILVPVSKLRTIVQISLLQSLYSRAIDRSSWKTDTITEPRFLVSYCGEYRLLKLILLAISFWVHVLITGHDKIGLSQRPLHSCALSWCVRIL